MSKPFQSAPLSESDRARAQILDAVLHHVPFEGWSQKALKLAVADTDLPDGAEALYFPGGPLDIITFWSSLCDAAMAAKWEVHDKADLRIRDKITECVWMRLETIGSHSVAAKRALSRLSLPDALGQGPKLLWASADEIWRAIGDTSTDGNYYSKRMILSGVMGATQLAWLGDETPDKEKARQFLEDRISNVMQFETAKFKLRERLDPLPNPAEILGQLRYGTRRRRRSR